MRDLLWQVRVRAGNDFSGVGVVICDAPDGLPIIPLRLVSTIPTHDGLALALASISVPGSAFHDGFHILSSKWQLVRVAQYFMPPILAGIDIDRSKLFGGRYLAALFGSAVPEVLLTGVASQGFGIAIFEAGKEKHFEPFHD